VNKPELGDAGLLQLFKDDLEALEVRYYKLELENENLKFEISMLRQKDINHG